MIPPKCKAHQQPSGWRCQGCKCLLCPDCVAIKQVMTATHLEVCVACGELADPITHHRSEQQSFAARLPGALVWPLSKAGLVAVAGVAIFRAVLSYFGGLAWLIGACTMAAVCFGFIRSTARGSDDFESFDFSDFLGDVILPGVKALVAAAVVWVPAAVWIGVHRATYIGNPTALLTDPAIWLLFIAGVLYAPMAILIGASGGSLLHMLNPLAAIASARRLGTHYLLAVMMLCILFIAWMVTLAFGAVLDAKVPIAFLPRLLDHVLACWAPFVAARVLGLLLYVHGDEVGYGLDSDYRVPLLDGVAPRGVVAEAIEAAAAPVRNRHAPIELEPLEAEPVAVAAEPERRRPTELDPAALPDLKRED